MTPCRTRFLLMNKFDPFTPTCLNLTFIISSKRWFKLQNAIIRRTRCNMMKILNFIFDLNLHLYKNISHDLSCGSILSLASISIGILVIFCFVTVSSFVVIWLSILWLIIITFIAFFVASTSALLLLLSFHHSWLLVQASCLIRVELIIIYIIFLLHLHLFWPILSHVFRLRFLCLLLSISVVICISIITFLSLGFRLSSFIFFRLLVTTFIVLFQSWVLRIGLGLFVWGLRLIMQFFDMI